MKRTKGNTALTMLLTVFSLLATSYLFTACSSDEAGTPSSPANTDSEIRFDVGVWNMMDGTRTTTYDNATALQNEGFFACAVYNANTTTSYISQTTVIWNSSQWVWSDGKHYWPDSETSLDFFAYMPAVKPSYISDITYAVNATPAPRPHFTCTLSGAEGKEFIWALTTGQNKTTNAAGVMMNFKHPFALVTFQKTNGSTYTINSVGISAPFLKTGTCTFDGTTSTWTDCSGTLNPSITFGEPFLVIPNNYGSLTVTANVTWSDWSNVTKDLDASATFNLQAGYSYTYTVSVSKDNVLVIDGTKFTEQW